jgi:mannose-1-phosphate guanylyltransferase
MSYLDHTYAVILAGGGGTRLWPKSRNETPKQFLKILGDETMIQVTASRITEIVPWERIIVVTNELYKNEVYKQLPKIPKENVIAEPQKRDTALAMLVGALFAKSKDPNAVIINLASDHVVPNQQEFITVMKFAAKTAKENEYLVAVGISPKRPSTGFGYIKIGQDLEKSHVRLPLFRVNSFTEKPNEATARGFISTGKYYWNANMYVWSATVLEQAFKKYVPKTYALTQELSSLEVKSFHNSLEGIYDKAESISIDYAVSEKADNLVLIPGDFGWDDVGDWEVVYNLEKRDSNGNVILQKDTSKNIIAIDSRNNLIHANGRLVSLVGVNDMVVIDTDEILMIIPKSRSQEVKKIVNRLKKENKQEYL